MLPVSSANPGRRSVDRIQGQFRIRVRDHEESRGQAHVRRGPVISPRAGARSPFRVAAQLTNVPMSRAMLCAISLSSGNDSIPITEYPSSHGIR